MTEEARKSYRLYGGNSRSQGGSLARFRGTPHAHGDIDRASLPADHPAVSEGRSLFHKSVVPAADSHRLFVSGKNQAKIGGKVLRGPWAGMPIYTFTLEERATCPSSCYLWKACYGNSTPFARRHSLHNDEDWDAMRVQLDALCAEHPDGVVLRLHVLGDFFSLSYANWWYCALGTIFNLRIFGYTARHPYSAIGREVRVMNQEYPDRCAIRFSYESTGEDRFMGATTHWGDTPAPPGIPCPQQSDKTATCGTCGMCWSPSVRDRTIVFRGHGMSRGRPNKKPG